MKFQGSFRLSICTLLLVVVSSSLCGQQSLYGQKKEAKPKTEVDYYKTMRTIVDTFEQIERNYVEEVDTDKLTGAAIRGMLSELDPYSSYIPPEDLARFEQDVEQKFGGIGIQVSIDPENKRLTVMTPLPGTPAYKAGIMAGDIIEEIEGKSTKGFTLEKAVKLLKGKAGEAVEIGIRHLGSNKIEQVKVVRDVIEVATVMGDHYHPDGTWEYFIDSEKKIAYIRLSHFSRRSADELIVALEELEKKNMKGLVLDLRFNPGGLLSQAVAICDMFIKSGRIVSTKGKNSPEREWKAKAAGTFGEFPMAILVNRFSASASEITSACLQDHKRAVIVGERTWGKGSVQNVIELQEGTSALKLTTASYHRPSGKNIHRFPDSKESDVWGVSPDKDYALKYKPQEIQAYLDYRRKRDVISQSEPPKSDYEDKQLNLALKYLKEAINQKKNNKDNKDNKDNKKNNQNAKPEEGKKAAQRNHLPKQDRNIAVHKQKQGLTLTEAANQLGFLRILPKRFL